LGQHQDPVLAMIATAIQAAALMTPAVVKIADATAGLKARF